MACPSPPPPSVKHSMLPRPVPVLLNLPMTDGRSFSLSSLRGKVVILNFFTTGCLPCQAMFKRFIKVRTAFGSHRVAIVAVGVDHQPLLVRLYAKAMNLPFPVLMSMGSALPGTPIPRVRLVPWTLILDKKGRACFQHTRVITTRLLGRQVAYLLKNDP